MATRGAKVLMGIGAGSGAYLITAKTMGLFPFSKNYAGAKASEDAVKKAQEDFQKLQAAKDCKSLLKKHLTQEVFDKLKDRQTPMGGTLHDIIVSGAVNTDANCGVYASDAEAYNVFKDLLDPIIEEYHKFGPKEKQPALDLGEGKLDYFTPLDPNGKYVQSTRIRCGRSIQGYPLNTLMTENQYLEMEGKVKGAVDKFVDPELKGKYYPIDGMTKETQTQLIKDHFLFKDNDRHLESVGAFHYWPKGRGIFHNDDKTFLIWLAEEDHMRIISMEQGGDVGRVLGRLNKGIRSIEKKVPFSRDDRLGWITYCPTNLGSTVRASVHIKLPKVSARKDFEKMCDEMNLQVRGIHGEHSAAEGGVYDVSNKRRLGLSEYEAVKEMYDGVKKLIELEEKGGN